MEKRGTENGAGGLWADWEGPLVTLSLWQPFVPRGKAGRTLQLLPGRGFGRGYLPRTCELSFDCFFVAEKKALVTSLPLCCCSAWRCRHRHCIIPAQPRWPFPTKVWRAQTRNAIDDETSSEKHTAESTAQPGDKKLGSSTAVLLLGTTFERCDCMRFELCHSASNVCPRLVLAFDSPFSSALPCVLLSGMAGRQVHEEYMSLHHRGADANSTLDTLRCGTVEQRVVWEERRACWRHGRYPRPGTAETTRRALKAAHGHTLLCKVPECRSLVDLQSARRTARSAGHRSFEPGDGCGSKPCSVKHWRGRFRAQQLKMAAALRDGSRVLVLWPLTTRGRVELKVAPVALADAVGFHGHA